MDSNVLAVQQYLNAICSGSPDWVPLEENGQTGTTTMQGTGFRHFHNPTK